MRSSLLTCALAVSLLSACHGSANTTSASASASPSSSAAPEAELLPLSDKYGFVRMDSLMQAHPLASQLAAINRQISILRAQLGEPQSARDLQSIHATQTQLQHQLEAAAAHAQSLLHDQGMELERQERAQISALLAKQGNKQPQVTTPRRASSVENFSASVAAQNQSYAKRLDAEREQAIQTLARSFNERDARIFREKQQALVQQENDDALKLAQADSAERVSLQTKVSTPGLPPAEKRAAIAALSGLDAKAQAQRKAEHAADEEILTRLHEKLQSDSQKEFNTQVAQIRSASEAQLRTRGNVAVAQATASMPPLPVPTPVVQSKALTTQIQAIHSQFQERFNADSRASVKAFKATRAQLQERFNKVARAHVDSQNALGKQIQTLERQRDALITKMTGQIQTKTVTVAEHASIDVVLTNVLAESNAVDLTDDVAHELTRTK